MHISPWMQFGTVASHQDQNVGNHDGVNLVPWPDHRPFPSPGDFCLINQFLSDCAREHGHQNMRHICTDAARALWLILTVAIIVKGFIRQM